MRHQFQGLSAGWNVEKARFSGAKAGYFVTSRQIPLLAISRLTATLSRLYKPPIRRAWRLQPVDGRRGSSGG
jgi:hypothetical protein